MSKKINKDNFEEQLDTKKEKMSKTDQDKLTYIKKRLTAMDDVRSDYEEGWKRKELQVDADVPIRDDGKAAVNIPIEQNIIEQKIGEKSGPIAYIIEPNGEADINILEPIKYTMDYFIKKEDVLQVINEWKFEKGTYGSGLLFSGVWSEVRMYSEIENDENTEIDEEGDFYGSKFKNTAEVVWHI